MNTVGIRPFSVHSRRRPPFGDGSVQAGQPAGAKGPSACGGSAWTPACERCWSWLLLGKRLELAGGRHMAGHDDKPLPFARVGAAVSGGCCARSPNSCGSSCSLCRVARAGRSVPRRGRAERGRAGGDSKSTGLKSTTCS